MTPERATLLREALWRGQFRPVAVVNYDDSGPSPGKRPVGAGWRDAALRDPPRWATEPARANAVNTGVLADGLRAIDFDIDDDALCQRCVAAAVAILGEAPTRYRRNSPRKLLLFRAENGTPPKRSVAGRRGKVEALGAGQQFVAFGVHDSGTELEWLGEPPGAISVA